MFKLILSAVIIYFAFNINDVSAQFVAAGKDTITTASGLKYVILKNGTGSKVEQGKEVGFHYTGNLTNGQLFGTSRGSEPLYFVAGKGGLIKGALEGIDLMREGDQFVFIISPNLAYGERGAGNIIPPNATLIFEYEVVSVTNPKLSINDTLYAAIIKDGIDKAVELYDHLMKNRFEEYAFREGALNTLGYKLMNENKLNEAIEILKLAVREYPQSFNVYDSLGEAYMNAGNNEKAIENYEKSIELNPGNKSGQENLNKLKGKKTE